MTAIFFSVLISWAGFAFDHSHKEWSDFLAKNLVKSGATTQVKYRSVKTEPGVLNSYLAKVSQVSLDQYKGFSETEKLAFLFNAYNAYTIKLIIDQKEIPGSIKDIKPRSFGNPLGNPWKYTFFDFLGKKSFLDFIEHELARKNFDEPRLHFAFNCASIGCPSLLPEAFQSTKLNEQLDRAAKGFLSDESRNRWDESKKALNISKIFDWYGKDFEKSKKFGSLRKFVADYMPLSSEAKDLVLSGKASIQFLDYNWKLNSAE